MAATRKPSEPEKRRRAPATTPEARERQMIALAVDTAEKQMREGTASAMVITHYLKLASTRDELERKKIERDIAFQEAKVQQMNSQKHIEELYTNALNAMRAYSGQDVTLDDDE